MIVVAPPKKKKKSFKKKKYVPEEEVDPFVFDISNDYLEGILEDIAIENEAKAAKDKI